MSGTDDDNLRWELMQADIENKRADTALKLGLLRYEPWKVAGTALGAGAPIATALIAVGASLQHVMR